MSSFYQSNRVHSGKWSSLLVIDISFFFHLSNHHDSITFSPFMQDSCEDRWRIALHRVLKEMVHICMDSRVLLLKKASLLKYAGCIQLIVHSCKISTLLKHRFFFTAYIQQLSTCLNLNLWLLLCFKFNLLLTYLIVKDFVIDVIFNNVPLPISPLHVLLRRILVVNI